MVRVGLPLLLLLGAVLVGQTKGGRSKTFLRSNINLQDQPQRTFFPQQSFNRQTRNYRVDDDPAAAFNFPGFSGSNSGTFHGGQSFRGRKGGTRSFGGHGGGGSFPGFGGPDSFLEEATTVPGQEDDPHSFQFPGGASFANLRASSGGGRKGGVSGASTFNFPDTASNFGARDGSSNFNFGGSGSNAFSSLSNQDLNNAAALFGRTLGGELGEGGGISSLNNGGTDFGASGNVFNLPGGTGTNPLFGSGGANSYFSSGVSGGGGGGGSRTSSSSSSGSSGSGSSSSSNNPSSSFLNFPGANNNNTPFSSSNIQFPSRGQFSGGTGNLFPAPATDQSGIPQFSQSGSFNLPDAGAGGFNLPDSGTSGFNLPDSGTGGFHLPDGGAGGFNLPYPLPDDLRQLLGGLVSTTTKPPLRVTAAEDHNKVFSGGQEGDDDVEMVDGHTVVPRGYGGGGRKGGSLLQSPPVAAVCSSTPTAPANGRTTCSSYSGCRAVCNNQYQFPSGERRLFLKCEDGQWVVTGSSWEQLPDCEPICNPECQNSGICLAPNLCQCPDSWEGSSCETPKAPQPRQCSTKPPTPSNSRIFCSRDECSARCHEGYHFEEGTTRLSYQCLDGEWIVRQTRWSGQTPNCKPVCDPSCQHGGRCIAPDVCECTQDYRGDACQYPISNCDPKKLGFNGGYNCSGEGMDFGCVLWCPEEVPFEFPAADRYTCDYATSIWSPSPIPNCDYGLLEELLRPTLPSPIEVDSEYYNHTHTSSSVATQKLPGTCFTWSGSHYMTFDGKIYSFESSCAHTLLQDATHGTFSVNIRPDPDSCPDPPAPCPRVVQLYIEDDQYLLHASESGGGMSLEYRDTSLAIPGQMNGVVWERVAHFVVLRVAGLGLTLKWDMQSLVVVEVSEELWNRTVGLCGQRDGQVENDWSLADGTRETNLPSFLHAWQATTVGERCLDQPQTRHPCHRSLSASAADTFCARLTNDRRFASCREVVDVAPFVTACRWDYCGCGGSGSGDSCACHTFAAFFRECNSRGVEVAGGWRSSDLCPMQCESGKLYNPCMPAIHPRCGQPTDSQQAEFCVEGCDCPVGLVLLHGSCVPASECPCTYRDKEYNPGDTIPNDCNSCTCLSGEWVCTETKCGSRCAVVGDPHYTTFDGRRYDFMGRCSYYLVQGQGYTVEAENTPCAGAISESMNFPASLVSQFPSCTKSVTVRLEGTIIKLKQDRQVTVNGVELRQLPAWVNGAYIKTASSLFIMVELSNGLDIWWDGQTRVYVDAPPEFRGETGGLCGTFTDNQRDDFLTPQGDIEQNPTAFANKWKTSERCPDQPLADEALPCERHVQNKAVAEKYCAKLKSNLFASCHLEVDPEPYYRDCLYDMCSCETKLDGCLCPLLAAYSKECARKGVVIDWRAEVRECGVHCTGGQKYQVCGNSCSRTCLDLATNLDCKRKCVEGCNCLDGFSLDTDGLCVPVTECPCVYEAKEFKPAYEMIQLQEDGSEMVCECFNAGWNCWEPLGNESATMSPQVVCSANQHLVYTDCLPEEEQTCQTMHLNTVAGELCRPGCVCGPGYVRNQDTNTCIPHSLCPCHHGGRSYQEGDNMQEDCNTCKCESGQWLCTTTECPAICTAWGDSHYKTFDGRLYEFHGTCDYLLAKGKASRPDTFEVTVQNVPCGTGGVTCAKSVTLRVGTGDDQEVVEFSRNKPPPTRNLTRTIIREAGMFVFAEVADMGLVLQWDKGTRAYLRLDPVWQGKVRGLCGNYNGDEQDDFQTPSGGSSEVSVSIFSDSWRLQNYCPDSILIKDTCSLHPHRKVWAAEKCAVLKSHNFTACHSEVPVEPYFERCQFDTCGCDSGGDCECLCTAIAAYAHECSIHGVYIRWRSQNLCPLQCDESCQHYEPCIPTCPRENCDTLLDPDAPLCTQDACVEGCGSEVCPGGQVHKSATDLECVPRIECHNKCLEVEGEVYMEGDIMSQDDCHTCTCSRKRKICRGTPCPTTTPSSLTLGTSPRVTTPRPPGPEDTTPGPEEWEGPDCRNGWSAWINEDKPIVYRQNSDTESVPQRITQVDSNSGHCSRSQIADIRCRRVGTHEPHNQQSGVTCSLPAGGLHCSGPTNARPQDVCWDYEVAFLCDCSVMTTEAFTTPTPATPITPPPILTPAVPPVTPPSRLSCESEGWTPWFNAHTPNTHGEFEALSEIRKTEALCPDHYISAVECRPVQGGDAESYITCDKKGALCRNNVGQQYCQDYEVRVFCECQCQDGLGMEDWSIPNESITASSLLTPDDKPHAGRLNADWAWTAATQDPEEEWLQVDLEDVKEVTGLVTQGHPYHDQYVEVFGVQYSLTGSSWEDVREPDQTFARQFIGNNDHSTPITNLFPEPVFARYIRIVPFDFHDAISLRLELKGCDVQESTTFSPEGWTVPSDLPTTGPYECVDGWTEWMNTHTPSPGDWDDMDDLQTLADKYTFCDAHQIVDTECQVAHLGIPVDALNQYGVVCNVNRGLQCNDELQAPNHCYDYEIRFMCDCSLVTSTPAAPGTEPSVYTTIPPVPMSPRTPETPEGCTYQDPQIKEHASDCRKFHECAPTATGRQYITKECGPGTFFHPVHHVCDFEANVILIRPECGRSITPPAIIAEETTSPSTTTFQPCTGDFWSEWFNVSHPEDDNGDFETFDKIREHGYELCDDMYIKDIHCQFNQVQRPSRGGGAKGRGKGGRKGRKGGRKDRLTSIMVDYTESNNQFVECSTTTGLTCHNYQQQYGRRCEDYAIRVLCSCEATRPTPSTEPSTTPYEDIRNVTIITTAFTIDTRCPVGETYNPEYIRCDRVCLYHRSLLMEQGICLLNSDFAPGCEDTITGPACPPGQFLLDMTRCVDARDCNCRLPNGMSAPPGRAFQVDECEKCTCSNNQLLCDSASCVTTLQPGREVSEEPIPQFGCNKWSSWVSRSEPDSEGNEQELITDLRNIYPKMCRYPQTLECRVKGSHESPEAVGQTVTCSRRVGLQCYRDQNSEDCKDYEVRFKCICGDLTESDQEMFTESTTPGSTTYQAVDFSNATTVPPMINDACPISSTYQPCAMPCDRICMYHSSILHQNGECLSPGDCAPGCVEEGGGPNTCPPGYFMLDQARCVSVADCTCRQPNGQPVEPGSWVDLSACERCQCHNNALQCQRVPNCEETVTTTPLPYITTTTDRYELVEVSGSPTTTPIVYNRVTMQTICDSWSPFYKKSERESEGSILTMDELKSLDEFTCENPVNATCREVTSLISAVTLGQTLTCDAVEGLRCLNLDNTQDCHNYEIAFYCDCGGAAMTTPLPTPSHTYGPTTTLVPCDAWSPWINNMKPWQADGDTEYMTLEKLRDKYNFCLEGHLANIECVDAGTGQNTGADRGTTCDVLYGYRCTNALQERGSCIDNKIRYYCTCDTTTAPITTTTFLPDLASPPSICDPDKYVKLLGRVNDNAFSSTPSRNSLYGPAAARLYNENGGLTTTGWSPAVNNHEQFIEVDLGTVEPVYGVVAAGNPLTRERVTAYTIQYSRDALTWTTLPQDPDNPNSPVKVLQGSYSPAEPLKQMFSRPVEMRYLRVVPTRWYRAIALRFDVIGCQLPTLSPTWTPEPERCVEKMGIENGQLSDLQITVSSVFNDQKDYYGKQHIRLHEKPVVYVSAGAWVAQPKPEQFVRFDLLEPSVLSGVVTQGRSGGPGEWVETFTIRYSPDGTTWTTLTDQDGSDKVFSGNYDGDTPVEHPFDRLLEVRYVEIRPRTWHNNIALRAELLGCYHPYPEMTTTPAPPSTTPTQPPPSYCTPCPGLPEDLFDYCYPCGRREAFNGQDCVDQDACPCYKDGQSYEFGAVFESRECEECECLLNGESRCTKKTCPPCDDQEDQAVMTPSCGCVCKPCPAGTQLCPTNNYCLAVESWCDGVEQCPDDEVGCPTTTPVIPDACPTPYCPEHWETRVRRGKGRCPSIKCEPPTLTTAAPCPLPACPPFYTIIISTKQGEDPCPQYECSPPSSTEEPTTCPPPSCPQGYIVEEAEYIDYIAQEFSQAPQQQPQDVCYQYQCVTDTPQTSTCPPPACPEGYKIVSANSRVLMELCPPYECVPLVTTTVCPPVDCPEDLQIMYIQGPEDTTCPQYTCLKITTPLPTTTPEPEATTCPPAVMQICKANEELYQTNPGDSCPMYDCKPVGSPPPPTTALPRTLQPECQVEGDSFSTFSDNNFRLEPCNHVLARDKVGGDWSISVHSNCSGSHQCDRYLNITQETRELLLRPDLMVSWDDHTYSVTQAQRIGSTSQAFSISRVANSIYFESRKHTFTVEWNAEMNVNITLGPHTVNTVDGLCGFFSGDPNLDSSGSDSDRTKPDGTVAKTVKEYGDSWAIDGDVCQPRTKCPTDMVSKAFELCNRIQSAPFSECHPYVDPASFMKGCVDRMCKCLTGTKDEGEGDGEEQCRCQSLTQYVTRCLEVNPSTHISDWRIATKCYNECGPGEVYQDCYRARCEQSCENFHTPEGSQCLEESGSCTPGCFCTPGLVRKAGRCVTPETCRDCVCEGYGDPHYTTFDRRNYTFNGECSYVVARDKNPRGQHHFQVITHNKQCTPEPVTVCTDSVTVMYGYHKVQMFEEPRSGGLMVTVDGSDITVFPHRAPWLALERPEAKQVMAAIPDIQLEVTFFLNNYGFSVRLPSRLYFNKTEGLCGNCNHDPEDDFQARDSATVEESMETFGRSWLLKDEPIASCGVLNKEAIMCLPLPPDIDPCLTIMDQEIFGKCHPVEDPAAYVSSCQLDACGSRDPEVAACHSLEAYARRCAQLDICLDWRSQELCPKICPQGQHYQSCGPGCVRTCDNYEELSQNPDSCPLSSVDGCFCPPGMVLDDRGCVNESACQTCDEEGHRVGEEWQTDPCTSCQCTERGSVCSTRTCPADPICDEGYIVVKVPDTWDDCCGLRKKCEVDIPECPPEVNKPADSCGYGQHLKLMKAVGVCPQYACVCLDQENCPEPIIPQDQQLKPGEEWVLDSSGCCERYTVSCTGECPEVSCPLFYVRTLETLQSGQCCQNTKCAPPHDACIYEHLYEIDDQGFEQQISPGVIPEKKLYMVNDSWDDGLCHSCRCVPGNSAVSEQLPHHQCSQQSCPPLSSHPDHGEYRLDSALVPGKCCPDIFRTACTDDYEEIEIGETLEDPYNGCRSVECVRTSEGRVEKREKIFSCDEACPSGWEYEPSAMYPQQCCGQCVQVGCVVESEVKKVGESWETEDHCTTYTCDRDHRDQIQVQAVEVQCSEPSDEDLELYTFETTPVPSQCCSIYTRTACLLNTITIQGGDSMQDPQDSCTTINCGTGQDGNVTRRERETTCDMVCDAGSTYTQPTEGSNECCGKCIKTHCVDDGETYAIGERWNNEDDICYEYSCEIRDAVITTVAVKRDCPFFDPSCPEAEIYMDDNGCCRLCNITITPKRDCAPKVVPPQETIGLFQLSTWRVGTCKNPEPVPDFRQCSGHCESFTQFQGQSRQAKHVSTCFCCKPSRFEKIRVMLRCDSGVTFSPVYDNIADCECLRCSDGGPEYMGDGPIMDETDFFALTEEPVDQ